MCALTGVTTPQRDYGEKNNIYIYIYIYRRIHRAITYNKGTI
jgi:hypothetical protein